MSVIPVAISGVFIVFALFRIPLSLPASIGLLALFGIVVNNSILIVDKINQNLAAGQEFNQAIVAGATSRLQPIFLTSLTTIIGLIPITLSDPMWEGLGGAIIAGLIFSGTLLLLYIPTLFAIMFHPQKLHQKDQNWHNFLHRLST
jgi:multidrug efflux pump subunit AcrB